VIRQLPIDAWKPAAGSLLAARGIGRSFGSTRVLEGVELDLAPGTIVGLVGPNGAGKTTLLHVLAGLLPPDDGEIWLEGSRVDFDRQPERRRSLGLLLGGKMLVEELRTAEYFDFVGAMFGLPAAEAARTSADLARTLRLDEHLEKPIKSLSAGTRKKVEFVAAILHRPKALLFDEPFEAVDPPAVQELTAITAEYVRANGACAIVSSHILPYVRPLATEIRLLWKGRLYERQELEATLANRGDDADLAAWRQVLDAA
jgi:ABC-2 type transport system ATP-binding protein